MKAGKAIAKIELKGIKKKALVDTGASRSVISKRLAEELKAFISFREPYELKTADEGGRLRIIGMPEIDSWDIIFTPEGPRPRKVPIEFEII